MMKIVYKGVGTPPEIRKIKGTLKEMQDMVGGFIEPIQLTNRIYCVCNEEGIREGLQPNFQIPNFLSTILGNAFFISQNDEGEFAGLQDNEIELVLKSFK